MTRRIFIAGLSFAALLITGIVAPVVAAQADITPEKIDRVRQQCVENQAVLNRLHQTDLFLRSDRGDLYRTINDKLMVPMNQRLISNRLDGGKLVAITAEFNKRYDTFFKAFIDYDTALTELQAINCVKEPVTFYATLEDVRAKREKVGVISKELTALVLEYQKQFRVFKTQYEAEKKS